MVDKPCRPYSPFLYTALPFQKVPLGRPKPLSSWPLVGRKESCCPRRRSRRASTPPPQTLLILNPPHPPPFPSGGLQRPPPYLIFWETAGLPVWPPWILWMGRHSSALPYLTWWVPPNICELVVPSAAQLHRRIVSQYTSRSPRLCMSYAYPGIPHR